MGMGWVCTQWPPVRITFIRCSNTCNFLQLLTLICPQMGARWGCSKWPPVAPLGWRPEQTCQWPGHQPMRGHACCDS
eukprot:300600-Pelagomonas_calceolata.AAC.1